MPNVLLGLKNTQMQEKIVVLLTVIIHKQIGKLFPVSGNYLKTIIYNHILHKKIL